MAEQDQGAPAASHADMSKAGEAPKPVDAAPNPEAERIATLERDNADLKDRLLRTLAEMENLRRRTEREVQDGRVYAITKFAGDMILTADNLRRAIDTAPKVPDGKDGEEAEAPDQAGADHAAALTQLLEGVALTERELLKALEKNGVKKRDPKGERFDPHRDQAMFEIPDETVPSGTVLQVVQAGYIIGERVLRPAMVGVSRGGPARPLTESSTAPAESASHEASGGAKPRVDKRA